MNGGILPIEVYQAIARAKPNFGQIVKSSRNTYSDYDYSTIDDIMRAVEAPLMAEGVLISHSSDRGVDSITVVTSLIHLESGQILSTAIDLPPERQNDPKAFGACLTYGRKYGLKLLLGLPDVSDVDRSPPVSKELPSMEELTSENGELREELLLTLRRCGSLSELKPFEARMRTDEVKNLDPLDLKAVKAAYVQTRTALKNA